jgi:hypothetical protein
MHIDRILAGTALALLLSVPANAFAQESNGLPATFSERFPPEQASTQSPPAAPIRNRQEVVTASIPGTRATRPHPRARVIVVRRSYLDAGTEVLPGERKFMDYAYPPTYQPFNVVTNLGGRVGWHNSPLPGPFFPSTN